MYSTSRGACFAHRLIATHTIYGMEKTLIGRVYLASMEKSYIVQ